MKIIGNVWLISSLITKLLTKNNSINLILFIFLMLVIIPMQFDLLRPALEMGLTPDDWSFIFWYKTLGAYPLNSLPQVWAERGPYTTVPLYYTGMINDLVNFNYKNLQLMSILFKSLATLVIFPLILIVFKNRLLAFLTTMFFAMTYISSGPLETAVEPTEYLGLFFIGLFLISYYFLIKGKVKWSLLISSTILLLIALGVSVMRVYPLLIFLLIVEFYLFWKNPTSGRFKEGFLRLLILFSPIILISLNRPSLVLSYIYQPKTLFSLVLQGNWQLILTPIQGLGHTLPLNSYWSYLGAIKIEDFSAYLSFFMNGPLITFGVISLFLSLFTSKNALRFFITVFIAFLFFGIAIFFIINYRLTLPMQEQINFDSPKIYPTIIGIFLLALTASYFMEWKRQSKKATWLLALWLGLFWAITFIVMTWLLASTNLNFGGAQDHYLMIPSVGVYLFISALIVIFYEKIKKVKTLFFLVFLPVLSLFIIFFYSLNRHLIHTYYNNASINGRAASGQILLQSKFKERIEQFNKTEPLLFYFDTSELENGPFYTESFLSSFPFWMRFQGTQLKDGCSERLYLNEHKQLIPYIREQDGQKGFFYKGLCVKNGKGGYEDIFYKMENFYAFKLKDRDFIDIKEEVLKELGF